ncbi:UDP-N-acetylmuramoyl-tripeptide--D-alanyl-D-alanine ligase [Chakrabartyella piscis]|uniref:UDP-N-acetylmuramoyl-tripeptide--D-alanyl-D- alanine ligase n=1 Tax=Chakrabartyella piscis TaxID=2918914 RepID=UPI002958D249|nr:UDP-N-acetylmuramoyl-tripeptide--D-alanyl-D-alanine ligase [Chakrabartyella piscis]
MKKMTIGEIAKATHAKILTLDDLQTVKELEITTISQDSRTVDATTLFLAIIGERLDGHDFIPQCYEKKVAACLCEKEVPLQSGSVILLVENVRKAMLALAKYYRDQFQIPFVGITGSVGKTTTKDMVSSVLAQKYNVLATAGNYNNDLGVPLTLFRLEEEHELAIIEMGMNHFGEIHALAEVVQPDIGLISNVGVAHIEFLGSREGIMEAKCEMFDHMTEDGVAILNVDNDMLATLDGKLPQKIRWFGVDDHKDIYADDLEIVGMEATKCKIHTEKGTVEVMVPMPGVHMVSNALSATAVALELGLSLEEIKKGIETFVPTKNRMNVIHLESGLTILNDVYNANPVSVKASLDILQTAEHRKIAILGFMGELGEYAPEMHKDVGAYAAKVGIDVLFFIGNHGECVKEGALEGGLSNVYLYANQEEFWKEGIEQIEDTDTILVKGSRSMALEKTVDKLQGVD